MDDKLIEKVQKRIEKLLLEISNDLHVAAKYQCSEIARLVRCWLLTAHHEYTVNILKGEFSDNLAHDILSVSDEEKTVLIDSTIWQIFTESKSILVDATSSMSGGD